MSMIDTAIILAGGLGTRLRPLTDTIPKPLLLVRGKPILEHCILNAKKYGVTKFILSTGYRAEQVIDYFGDGRSVGVRISYSLENEPLGTGGAVRLAATGLRTPFFLIWGDNLTDINFQQLYQAHHEMGGLVTMTLTPREDVENFGVAKLEGNRIITFIEKPLREQAPSNLINAGAFVIDPDCLTMLPDGRSSMEKDCFEKLAPLGKIISYVHADQWLPTDTIEKYYHGCAYFTPVIDFKQKKCIIADVDDTICHSCQQVTPAMAQQISHLIQQGYQFAFISGTKAEDLLTMISSQIKQEHHILATTGTEYLRVNARGVPKVMYTHSFTEEEKREITSAFEQLIEHFGIISLTTKEDQLQDRDSQITLSAIGRHAPTEAKAAFDPQGKKRKAWIDFLQKEIGEEKYDFKIGGTTSIDVTRKGWDKEWGIREFAACNVIPLQRILFLGDKMYPGGNDHPATKIVDCITVANPEDTLQKLRQLSSVPAPSAL